MNLQGDVICINSDRIVMVYLASTYISSNINAFSVTPRCKAHAYDMLVSHCVDNKLFIRLSEIPANLYTYHHE